MFLCHYVLCAIYRPWDLALGVFCIGLVLFLKVHVCVYVLVVDYIFVNFIVFQDTQ